MTYQTGTPSSTKDLIDIFIAFAVAEAGFTLGNEWTFAASTAWVPASGSSSNWKGRALLRDSQYVYLCWPTDGSGNPSAATNRVAMNSGTNNPTTGLPSAQTSAGETMIVEMGTAPLKYWMFSDGNGCHCVAEWVGGAYQHISIGMMQKYGSFAGGVYVTGSANNRQTLTSGNYYDWDSSRHGRPFDAWDAAATGNDSNPGHLRADYSGQRIHAFGQRTSSPGFVASNLHMRLNSADSSSQLYVRSPSSYNARAALIPIELIISQTDSANPASWIPVGRVNNAAYIRMLNLIPTQTILTDWMVFPVSAKNAGGTPAIGYVNSANLGMAYKK